jgi:hypothetical protein
MSPPDDDDRLPPDGSQEIYLAPLEEALKGLTDTEPPPPAPPTGPELPVEAEAPIPAGAAERALRDAFVELARVVRCCEALASAVGRQLDAQARTGEGR